MTLLFPPSGAADDEAEDLAVGVQDDDDEIIEPLNLDAGETARTDAAAAAAAAQLTAAAALAGQAGLGSLAAAAAAAGGVGRGAGLATNSIFFCFYL